MMRELETTYRKQERSLRVLREMSTIYYRTLVEELPRLPVEVEKAIKAHIEGVLTARKIYERWWRLTTKRVDHIAKERELADSKMSKKEGQEDTGRQGGKGVFQVKVRQFDSRTREKDIPEAEKKS